MLRISLWLFVCLLSLHTGAQNIIQNGSFENYISCPTGGAQVPTHCVAWRNHANTSPDYFNACSTGLVDVPNNAFGSEPAANGDGYGGFLAYFPVETREYLGASIAPLTIGTGYELSMSVSVADNSLYGCNGLGVLFYKNGTPTSIAGLLALTPQVLFPNVFTNQTGWVRVSAGFVADSAYTDIVVGSFKGNGSITLSTVSGTAQNTYLYVDSVVLIPTPPISYTYANLLLCAGDTIYVPYTKVLNTFNTGNVFTLQLSDATGSFASPVNIGTLASTASGTIMGIIPKTTPAGAGYRIRITSSNQAYVSMNNGADIQVKTFPDVTATYNSPVCEGAAINLSASSLPGATYGWTGPVSFSSAVANPVISPSTLAHSGDYIVTATLNGCKAKDTVSVTIKPTPVVSAAGNNGPLCEGNVLNLSGQSNAGTYSWTGPAFSSTQQNPQINNVTTANSGIYTVTATLNGCTSLPVTTTVVVNIVPAIPAATNSGPLCETETLSLFANSTTPGASYSWIGPSFSSTQQNPQVTNTTVANGGVYAVTATLNGCTSAAATTGVAVKPMPAVPAATSNSPVCTGGILNLFGNSTTPGVSYNWTGVNNFTSNLQNPSIDPVPAIAAGVYDVTATLNGCTSPAGNTTVVVNTVTYLGAYASPDDTLCENDSLTVVTVPVNGGSNPVFQWYKNNAAIPGATQLKYLTLTALTGDTFYCRMIAGNVCNTPITLFSNKIGIKIISKVPVPVVSIHSVPANPLPGNMVVFTANITNGGTNPQVQWLRNGQDIAGATLATWSAANLYPYDKISVRVTSSELCPDIKLVESNVIEVNFPTGVAEQKKTGFEIYPNPNKGRFTIHGTVTNDEPLETELINPVGQVVYSKLTSPAHHIVSIEITLPPAIAPGIYLLRMKNSSTSEVVRMVVTQD